MCVPVHSVSELDPNGSTFDLGPGVDPIHIQNPDPDALQISLESLTRF